MTTKKTETLRGVVRRVFSANPEGPWMAGIFHKDDGGSVRFSGKVVAAAGDIIEVSGQWGNHPTYGEQFEVETGIVRMDESPEALAHLLASNPDFKGIGPSRARAVVDAALLISDDGDISSALRDHPLEIAKRSGVKEELVLGAAKAWLDKREHFEALARVVDQGWSSTQAAAIIEVFGGNAAATVRGNPYLLIGKVPRFGFRTVDAVARKLGVASNDPARLEAGVAFSLDHIGNEGHTWSTREDILQKAAEELRPDTLDGEANIAAALDALIAEKIIHTDTSPNGNPIVAEAALAGIEFEVFASLLSGLRGAPLRRLDYNLPSVLAAMRPLNAHQDAAVRSFSESRFGVITGRAGSGKTFATDALCTVAEENGLKVELCAPTGKAARKLSRASNRPAQTIHRLLEPHFNNRTGQFHFTRHAGLPLEVDLVIIDETSMVDVRLMRSLLVALPPEAQLLLVGDHHQIPSVGAGAVLRDLLAAQDTLGKSVHVLGEVVRQAGVLQRNISALLDGVVDGRTGPSWGIERTERGHEEAAAAAASMLVEALATTSNPAPFGRDLDLAWDIQVLAPMRRGPLGTYALNVHLQKLRQRLLGNAPPAITEKDKAPKPLIGDRIIWTKNDYDLGLLNGTQALVVEIRKGGALDILTEDGNLVTVEPGRRKHVEVAYAMTIHKAQGSEWPAVVLVISSTHRIMRDRNLLYTGASRAAESLTILGDMAGIKSFAHYQRSARRQTFGGFLVHGWMPTL